MSDLNRRDALKVLAAVPVTRALDFADLGPAPTPAAEVAQAAAHAPYTPKFFSAHEWATVRVLVDDIIPRDERSGSATDAGAPEYIDFLLADQTPAGSRMAPTNAQIAIQGGLSWLDDECQRRFSKRYASCAVAERHAVLDDIAWPAKAKPEFSHGVAFFNRMRDLTGAAFFSSKLGVQDLRYTGNTFVTEWKGCPDEALQKLGVRY